MKIPLIVPNVFLQPWGDEEKKAETLVWSGPPGWWIPNSKAGDFVKVNGVLYVIEAVTHLDAETLNVDLRRLE